jgi:hypothetical protein
MKCEKATRACSARDTVAFGSAVPMQQIGYELRDGSVLEGSVPCFEAQR